ncbi:hypothetical protein AGG97_35995 [Klebsiella michiganensis]|nr:hypothetical protein AGG97_35995 [Klebsiella michiganensis]
MAAFAIMRCKKLSGIGSVAASLKHCFRERDTPNADPERLRHNMHMAARSTDEAMGKLREKLPEKRRKDAVLAIEYVLSASPEWWINADSGPENGLLSELDGLAGREVRAGKHPGIVDSPGREDPPHVGVRGPDHQRWAVERQGVHRQPHQDEQRPEQLCRGRQAPWTGAGHRGQQGDPQAHQGPLQRAGAANPRASRDPGGGSQARKASKARGCWARIGLRPMIETPLGVADRLNAKFAKAFKVVAEKASESDSQRGAAVRARMALADTQKQLQALQEPFKGLSKEQVAEVLKQAVAIQQDNQRRQQEQVLARKLEAEIRRKMAPEQGRSRVGVLGVKPCPAPLQLRSGPFAGLAHVLPQGRDLLGVSLRYPTRLPDGAGG